MSEVFRIAAAVDSRVALVVFLLVVDAWGIGMILASSGSRREKAWWSAIVLLCPIIGLLLWYNLGPRPEPGRRRDPPAAPR